MNDRPEYRTGQLMCETGNPCLVAENAQPGSAVYLPGHHPLSTRGTAPTASFLEGGSVSVGQGKADLNVLVIEPDGNQLGYQLEQLSSDKPSANMFAIGSDGIIRVQAGAVLNYEHGGTGQNQYKITVKVFDQIDSERSCPDHYDPEVGSCYASKMLVINVLNVNDPPTFPGNYHGAKISANEDETWTKDSMQGPIATLIAGFDDDGNVLSYSIKNVPTDSAYASDQLFELEQQNGEFRVRLRCKLLGAQTPLACQDGTNSCDNKACFPILDFESKPLHKLRLHVTDNIISASNPPASTFMDINIEVLDVNEPPEFCFSGSQSQFLPALSLGEWNAFKSQAPSYNDPAYDNLRSRKGCDPAQLVESDTTMRPHLTFWVPEDAEVGHVVATMDDFYFFDTDQSHTPVEHRFALNILELALAKPTNYPSPLNEQAELRYNIDELTGVITVAKTLDLDATTNGQQDFVLTAFDGVSRGRALVRIYLKQIDEPPVAKDHVFCVDEMVGHDPFECNDISDSALFTQKTGVPTHRRCPFVYRVESPEECGSTFPRRWIPKAAQSGADGSYDQRAFSGLYEPEDDPLEFERLGDLALGEFEVVPNCQTNARAPAECKVGGTWDSAFSLAIPLQLQVRPGTGDSLQTPESGALIDFEYQSRSTVDHQGRRQNASGCNNTVTALVVVIDRNDVPEWWGSRPAPGTLRLMPPLFGGAPSDQGTHDQWNGHHITDDLSGSTSESIKFHYKYLSPRVMRTDEDTALANPNKFNIVHETVTKTYHVPRTRAAPFQIPIHSFCSTSLGTCTAKRLGDEGVLGLNQLKRTNLRLGFLPAQDPDCVGLRCSPSNFNEMHYSLPTAWVDKGRALYIEETRPSDAPATDKHERTDAGSVWPAVFTCSDPRRLDNNPTCTLAQSETDKNCWAYTSVAECEINGIKDPCSSPGTYGQECIKCKRNTVHCKTWSSTPVEHFWPFHIHELTGEVRVSMFCPQMEAESWLKASAHLHDNSAAGCSGSTQNDKSLLHPNTLFRVPLRIEDRGTGKRIGGTPLGMECTGKGNLCETQAESPDLWSEAYFDVFVSPNNIPPRPTAPNPLEVLCPQIK